MLEIDGFRRQHNIVDEHTARCSWFFDDSGKVNLFESLHYDRLRGRVAEATTAEKQGYKPAIRAFFAEALLLPHCAENPMSTPICSVV
jgi:hypothetical protein